MHSDCGCDFACDFDFAFDPSSTALELRIPVGNGDVIAGIQGDGVVRVRAGNGTFRCDPIQKNCSDDDGNGFSF